MEWHPQKPEWNDPLERFIALIEETERALRTSKAAIEQYGLYHWSLRKRFEKTRDPIHEGLLRQSASVMEDARKLIESGHRPIINSAVISLWAAFEATVTHFITIVTARRGWRNGEKQVQDIRSIRPHHLLRLEALLDDLNMPAKVPPEFVRHIAELYVVRNLLAHQSGFIDQKFISKLKSALPGEIVYNAVCKRTDLIVGTRYEVLLSDYARFAWHAREYICSLAKRAKAAGL